MIALTLRQRNIIEYLLSRDSYVTNDVIASNFEVSNRTVRKDLEVISAYLKEQRTHFHKGFLKQCISYHFNIILF